MGMVAAPQSAPHPAHRPGAPTRSIGLNLEGGGEFARNLSHRALAIALVPNKAGRGIQLVNPVRGTVQHNQLSLDRTNADVRITSPRLRLDHGNGTIVY
jgi:hypothetical protein